MEKEYYAKLTIYDLPTMTSYKKAKLIKWLCETADSLKDDVLKRENLSQDDFNKIYTLRLMK